MTSATTPSYVQIPPNSSGLKIRTVEVTDDNGNVVECQAIVTTDPITADYIASVSRFGELSVADTLNQLLYEVVGQTKRVARLLEILTDHEVTLSDVD